MALHQNFQQVLGALVQLLVNTFGHGSNRFRYHAEVAVITLSTLMRRVLSGTLTIWADTVKTALCSPLIYVITFASIPRQSFHAAGIQHYRHHWKATRSKNRQNGPQDRAASTEAWHQGQTGLVHHQRIGNSAELSSGNGARTGRRSRPGHLRWGRRHSAAHRSPGRRQRHPPAGNQPWSARLS